MTQTSTKQGQTHRKNRLVVAKRERVGGGTEWEAGVSKRRLLHTGWIYNKVLLYSSMGFSRQEYWRRLPFPSPGDLPTPGIEPGSTALQADSLPFEPPGGPLYSTGNYTQHPMINHDGNEYK